MHLSLHTSVPKHAANRACYGCGSSSRKVYVDLGIVIDYEGAVVLCSRCITALAQMIDLPSAEEAKDLRERVVALEAQVDALAETAGKHHRLVEALGESHIDVDDEIAVPV